MWMQCFHLIKAALFSRRPPHSSEFTHRVWKKVSFLIYLWLVCIIEESHTKTVVEQILGAGQEMLPPALIWKRMRDRRGNNSTFLSGHADLWDDSHSDRHLWAETQHNPPHLPFLCEPPSRGSVNHQISFCSVKRSDLFSFGTTEWLHCLLWPANFR